MQNSLKPISLVLVIFICFCNTAFSQIDRSTWQVGANVGYSVYSGDLTPKSFSGYKSMSYFFSLSATKLIDPMFSVRLNISHANIKADESKYSAFHKERAFSFSTNVTEIAPVFNWNILGNNYQEYDYMFSPYVYTGVGLALLSVNRDYSKMNRTIFNANHWVSKGLSADTAIMPKSAFLIPIGAGAEYYINDDFSLTADFTYRFYFTDYLDGYSKSGNSGKHDTYHSFTIGVIHTLFSGRAGGVSSPRSIY